MQKLIKRIFEIFGDIKNCFGYSRESKYILKKLNEAIGRSNQGNRIKCKLIFISFYQWLFIELKFLLNISSILELDLNYEQVLKK